MQVSLCNIMLTWLKPVVGSGQEDAFALTTRLRLDNKCLSLLVIELFLKRLQVCWQEKGLWKEAVLFGEVLLKSDQVLCEQILASQCIHAWKVIGSLVRMHLDQQGWNSGSIDPPKVPVLLFISTRAHVALLSHFVHDLVLRVCDVDAQLWVIWIHSVWMQLLLAGGWRWRAC